MESDKIYLYPHVKYENIKCEISLNENEKKIFDFFLQNNPSNSVFRVAGGWVRDKLLNKPSDDIDITIDNITGKEYADMITEKNKEITIIKNSNEKSSHLQTATIVLFDKQIDIVNLRKEVYQKNSRVPEVSLGTPEEDVYRRDITINCLYYNINTGKVEDLTGKGIEDLKNGIIRMPKSAYESLSEDPLRMLRVIRFATRFQFTLDNDIVENIGKKELIENYVNILSNERIQKEMTLMLEGPYPHSSVHLLNKFGILEHVLKFPYDEEIEKDKKGDFMKSANMISVKHYLTNVNKLFGDLEKEFYEKRKIINYALVTSPVRKYIMRVNWKEVIGSKIILSMVLKLTNAEVNEITFLIEQIDKVKNLIETKEKQPKEFTRKDVGLYLRGGVKEQYLNIIFLLCACDDYCNEYPETIIETIDAEKISSIVSKYLKLKKYIYDENLQNVSTMKAIINGKVLITEYNIKKTKHISAVLEEIIQTQIENPKLTPDEAREIVKKMQPDLK